MGKVIIHRLTNLDLQTPLYNIQQLCTCDRNSHASQIHFKFIDFLGMFIFLRRYLLTYSMEQSPSSDTNWFSASREIPFILWNPMAHYRIYKCLPTVPILCQIDPVLAPTSYFLKIHLNIILQSIPGSSKWFLSIRFPHQNPVYKSPLPLPCCMSPSQFILLDLITQIIFGELYIALTSS